MKPAKHLIYKSILALVIFSFSFSACKKDNQSNVEADATVINSGPVAADGCGWLIKINNTNAEYSPVNLAAKYEIDSLKVHIVYSVLTTKTSCGVAGHGVTQIKLSSISNQ